MDEKKIEVFPNQNEISELTNELYRKQDEFDLSNPYGVGYVLINKLGYRKQKQGRWIYSQMGCVINCSNCGERLELCYPDGTEIRETAYCPFCGAKMKMGIEITEKAIRKNEEKETAFVNLLNQETKELSDSFDSYLLLHGYRKESDTAREILQDLESALMYYRNSDIACEFVFDIMGEIAKKHGVDLTGDKE